jgi:hypothetical protein
MEGGLNLAAMSSGEGAVGEFDGLSELWQINSSQWKINI